jgi:hypothetical protein
MIRSYALLFIADLCHFLAVDLRKAIAWLERTEIKLLSKSYLAQGSGPGPWTDE